jgi:beta-phosphoglucomutase-like phosphatase (HAD superfamily)
VEDSLSGVVAALAAGMTVVGFVGGSHCGAGHSGAMLEAGCTQVFDRMERLAEFLVVRIHTRLDHQGRSK